MILSKLTTKQLVILYDLVVQSKVTYEDQGEAIAHSEIIEKIEDLMFNKEIDIERFDLTKL